MVCLGLEPGAAGWKAQTNPLSYCGTNNRNIFFRVEIWRRRRCRSRDSSDYSAVFSIDRDHNKTIIISYLWRLEQKRAEPTVLRSTAAVVVIKASNSTTSINEKCYEREPLNCIYVWNHTI